MNWRIAQQGMIEELNTKIFFDDPCRKLREEYSSMDIENNNYIQELKNRKNSPERYDGSLIEKKKYNRKEVVGYYYDGYNDKTETLYKEKK